VNTLAKVCIDVSYLGNDGYVAGVAFSEWTSSTPLWEGKTIVHNVEPYEPGSFYKRELPCILAILKEVPIAYDTIIIDGYVWLGAEPGMGVHVYDALNKTCKVIGVAKTEFRNATSTKVSRNRCVPLYVTSIGISEVEAAAAIQSMIGPYRIPTLLKRADTLSRSKL
jgi:deoxyribonuclease V